MAIGQVRLPVTFDTRDNYRTESLDFDVTYIALPYNSILGYPALARFMVATHHGFNVLKIPGANDTITVCCNEKDALRSVEHVYREAAAMFPTDEDLLEHSGDLMRKKQCRKSGLLQRRPLSSPSAGLVREEIRHLCITYSKRGPGPSDTRHEHWGSCGTLNWATR
jgi:hypothetical protein